MLWRTDFGPWMHTPLCDPQTSGCCFLLLLLCGPCGCCIPPERLAAWLLPCVVVQTEQAEREAADRDKRAKLRADKKHKARSERDKLLAEKMAKEDEEKRTRSESELRRKQQEEEDRCWGGGVWLHGCWCVLVAG